MTGSSPIAAIDGWYSLDSEQPHLIGSQCQQCGTYYFPKQSSYCKNPGCDSEAFDEVPLSREGKIWSYTNACYQPPEPYIAAEPFVPFSIAAVELEKEQMIILGQTISGITPEDMKVGQAVELVLEPLHDSEEGEKLIWKWRPLS
ncbi:OB-fold domain-containing protein [Spongiibacter sp. KMU-158]|uniref:OB-fold domain-containing protein n=1 Tax=Spongiibacter pelagi TaxID=2760804 RepID=A0A927GV24_9GAMM|nr:OB-fold domain-containing protein [Spongiibacter pelagi]MBD2858226.1 OB-fold domain-containing protein [Spongiibacter pelagi]